MQHPSISPSDKKDLDKFTRFLCMKASQVIVQGRLGKTISTQCSPMPTGSEWFNLAIKDYPEIHKEARSALLEGNPTFRSSFVVEISLRTSDSESLTLEVWSISVTKKFEDARVQHTVYNRMSLLLKSLICVSRATPAYKLSRKQGSEYVICFRVYTGKVDIAGLGEGFKTLRVGSIGTPTGTITLSAAFRTSENLHVSTKRLAPEFSGPMKVSHDHFCSPRMAAMSPARPCHTLRSRLMNSKEFSSGSQSSSGPLESPSYGMLPTSFSTSPGEMYMESSRNKGAVFTIGTPPSNSAYGRTPPCQRTSPLLSGPYRRLSDATPPKEGLARSAGRKPRYITHSHSEQNFSDPKQSYSRKEHRRKTIQEETFQTEKLYHGNKVPATLPPDSSMHSTLKNEDSVFRPISSSPLDKGSRCPSDRRSHRSPGIQSVSMSRHSAGSNVDGITTLKSHSPTSAKVGFPDNTLTTLHLTHLPPSLDVTASAGTTIMGQSRQCQYFLPSPGAFVSNSKTAKRAYDTLNEISTEQKLPFEDLLSGDISTPEKQSSRSKSRNSGDSSSDTSPETLKENTGSITRFSSQSSLSSHPSSESSPRKDDIQIPPRLTDEFLMIDLKPAFGSSDSAKDLCAFYREIESASDLLMFQENSGRETHETLLDLAKQLEDYQRDAEGFDEFVKELEIV